MFAFTFISCFVIILGRASAKLALQKNVNELVTFDGSDCALNRQIKMLLPTAPLIKKFTMNRQGQVYLKAVLITTINDILINKDQTLEVILSRILDSSTKVTPLNADRFVPPEPVLTAIPKKSDSMAKFSIVVIVLLAIDGWSLPVKFATSVAVPQPRSSTTVGKPTSSPDARPYSSAPPFDNALPCDSTKESASFTVASGRRS
uniref:Uncharacterized protein n=1 Tax=Panagrellus redivivus TaxID=6233 RepID=A0A7E4UWB2_PANRE